MGIDFSLLAAGGTLADTVAKAVNEITGIFSNIHSWEDLNMDIVLGIIISVHFLVCIGLFIWKRWRIHFLFSFVSALILMFLIFVVPLFSLEWFSLLLPLIFFGAPVAIAAADTDIDWHRSKEIVITAFTTNGGYVVLYCVLNFVIFR